jgi:hypothetical protein
MEQAREANSMARLGSPPSAGASVASSFAKLSSACTLIRL